MFEQKLTEIDEVAADSWKGKVNTLIANEKIAFDFPSKSWKKIKDGEYSGKELLILKSTVDHKAQLIKALEAKDNGAYNGTRIQVTTMFNKD